MGEPFNESSYCSHDWFGMEALDGNDGRGRPLSTEAPASMSPVASDR